MLKKLSKGHKMLQTNLIAYVKVVSWKQNNFVALKLSLVEDIFIKNK